ncbi:MAG: STAS domain-containing protein [Solirubrobacteraceae bacterium]
MDEDSVFEVVVERPDGGSVVVRPRGELDLLSAPQVQEVLERAQADRVDLVLDLTGLDFIDSTGVHLVLDAFLASQRDGWDLSIVGAGEEVRRAFELVGLIDHLPFRDSGQTAS